MEMFSNVFSFTNDFEKRSLFSEHVYFRDLKKQFENKNFFSFYRYEVFLQYINIFSQLDNNTHD